jgi:hypothetical protein
VLEEWVRHLSNVPDAFVFCSKSPNAVDPSRTGVPVIPVDCRFYKVPGQIEWLPWPAEVKVRHPFRGKNKQASAFVVERIECPPEFSSPSIRWLSKGLWQESRMPTRGEYLIKRGGSNPMRPVSAILKLCPPYLVAVSPGPS